MRLLIALYPRAWRRRYGAEFAAVLEDEPPTFAGLGDVVLGAIDAHLHPQLHEADTSRSRRSEMFRRLRSLPPVIIVGVLLPFAFFGAGYLIPELRDKAERQLYAVATGLLIGRWWAPAPFLVLIAALAVADARTMASLLEARWMLVVTLTITALVLVGAGARMVTHYALRYRGSRIGV